MPAAVWLLLSSIFGALAVACGAFGAHGLKGRLGVAELAIFDLAARYHMYHALALMGLAFLASQFQHPALRVAGWCFSLGIFLFSGSIYALALCGYRWLSAFAPLGGLAFIAGWLALAWAALIKVLR